MKKIHKAQGKRIQNGEPFDWMLEQMAKERNEKGLLSDKLNITDVSRHAIIMMWRKTGHAQIPAKALEMLNVPIDDLDL
jgi:hypothetical protein